MELIIDNYDSFTYNLYQYMGTLNPDIQVIRNDAITVEEIRKLRPDHLILSPGPGRPCDAGVCEPALRELKGEFPILGVCLGHQAIGEVFGGTVTYARQLMHGKQSTVTLDRTSPLFKGLPEQILVGRYHSLAIDPETLPEVLKPIATTEDGEVMAVEHREYPIYGLQFHPESILTPEGMNIIRNFLDLKIDKWQRGGSSIMIKEAIIKLVNKGDLTYNEAKEVMLEIMGGKTTPTQNAAFLAALSTKSTKAETIDEITGCAEAMRSLATPVPHPGMEVMEIVGTGGDGAHSFNISTTSAMVLAAGGVKVAKHGNRAASSLCGTADCLEALGVNIQQDPDLALKMLQETNFCFLFAQKYHAAMKYVGPIRKELGFRTVFNILGPLTNPAKPEMFLLGVYDGYLVEPLAKVLCSLGVKRGLVAYGQEKLDEISPNGPTTLCELRDGYYRSSVIRPEDFGLVPGKKEDLVGGTPEENAKITRDILSGKLQGTKRNAVLMNAGAGLFVAGKAETIAAGVKLAAELIDSGKALAALEKVIQVSNQ